MTESKREASVRLWRICFKDPEPFIELYFHKVFREDYTLLQYSETGEAVAHLQMLPYQLRIFGTSFSAGYISGACTHPDHRGKGIMRTMMVEALSAMYDRGDICSFLIPAETWLYDFYSRSGGYAPAFGRKQFLYRPNSIPQKFPSGYACTIGQGDYSFLSAEEHTDIRLAVQHTLGQWQTALKDFSLAGGNVAMLQDSAGKTVSQACFVPRENSLDIKLLVGDAEATFILVDHLLRSLDCDHASILAHSGSAPYGMLRILRPIPILEAFAQYHPAEGYSFAYSDPLFSQHNGIYHISKGRIVFSNNVQPENSLLPQHTPDSLVKDLFSPFPSALFLMLD